MSQENHREHDTEFFQKSFSEAGALAVDKVVSRVAIVLRIAAQSLRNSTNKLGEYCRRMKARLGKAEGITATARKLARILYAVITRRMPYDEAEVFKFTPASQARCILNLRKQAAKLGLQLVPTA